MAGLKTKSCRCCDGSGKQYDHRSVGREMTAYRKSENVSQVQVAKRMGYTTAFICDLEHGRRNWRTDLIEAYRKACKK